VADHARLDRFAKTTHRRRARSRRGCAPGPRLEHDAAEQPHFSLEQAVRVHRFDRLKVLLQTSSARVSV